MASVGDATSSKRSRVKTERMQEFEKSQEDNVTQKLLKCPKDGCDKVFTSVPGLRYHTKTHVEPDRRFICEKCDKSFKSANGLKYHRGKTKGCDLPASGYQLEKSDKSSNSEGDTEDSATEDFTSQEMSADESLSYYQHLHLNDKNRENCDSVNLTEMSDDLCAIKSKPLPLLLSTLSESTVVATPSTTSWPLMDDGCTSDVNKLQQLAIIATGPESPLLKPETNMNHKRVCSDGSDPQVTSSSPCPTSTKEPCKESGTWSHTWPTTVWQCFMKGVQIQFPENTWQTAEELARIEQLRKSSSGKENSQDSYAAKGLRLVRMTKILEKDKDSSGKSWHLHLNMSPDLDNQSSLLAKCAPDHPFFVLEKGWSSYSPAVTVEHYGIPCRKLEEDDICLPPSHHDATFTHDVFETLQQSLDFTPSDSSAVLALSNMAKQRRDLEQENLERRNQENQAKKQNAIKTDSLKAKRPMNGFMLFAKKNRLEYTQMYPGKDNRAISVMLGDRWKKMKTEERSVFAEEAKHLAEQQKRMHPDCWKRKSVKSCNERCRDTAEERVKSPTKRTGRKQHTRWRSKKASRSKQGVGIVMRKMANAATPVQEIKIDGDTWNIKTSTTFKTTDIHFKIDEEFDETTGDGRKVKTTCKIDGNALIQDQKGSPDSVLSREVKDGKMHMILKVNDIVCTRIYKHCD